MIHSRAKQFRFEKRMLLWPVATLILVLIGSTAAFGQVTDPNNPLGGGSTIPPGSNGQGLPDPYDTTGDAASGGRYQRQPAPDIVPDTSNMGTDLGASGTNTGSSNGRNYGELRYRSFDLVPPDKPTEFQKLVASSTGKFLSVYGAQLFRNVPSTFAPLDRVPVTPEYVVGPGDELIVTIWGQVRLNGRFTVDRAGEINIPRVGSIRVAGLNFGELQSYLKTQVGKNFRNFDLNVDLGALKSIQIFVVGQARHPGSYTVSALSTLVNALFVTGGPAPQGSLRNIQLKREGKVIASFDLYELLQKGDKSGDVPLMPGDVLFIPQVGPQVALIGEVNNPAIYELKAGTESTIDDVLTLAAGSSSLASAASMRLERIDDHRMRAVADLALDAAGRGEKLRDGDVVELLPILGRFKNGVTLRGNVANPGHYGWHPGMRVGELFPDKDALITRDYWLRRGRLGNPVLNYVPVCPPPATNAMPTGSDSASMNSQIQADPQRQAALAAAGSDNFDDPESQGCIRLPDSNLPTNPATATTGTALTGVGAAQAQMESTDPSQRAGQQTASGSAASAMIERSRGQFAPRNDVRLSAPDIDWSYAVIERQDKETLTTALHSFKLGALVLDKDQSQNLELEPGDVVTIFSKADIRVPQLQQTRFVRLEGEFESAGVYSVMPNETLRDVVKRAGGFTKQAYLYGSEFTRESVRRVQQQRLNEYVDQVALQSSTAANTNANKAISGLDAAAAAATASQSQTIIANLRQARVTGRIVMELKPSSDSVDEIPAISLEDGDRFIVPHVPTTVNVAGAVYNPNAFLFREQLRVRDYLRLAGGANRDSDRKSSYVIRADGSVVSRRQMSEWHRDNFDGMHIYPGDTVIVPLNLNKGSTLRNVVDIASVVGQFGISIATLHVLGVF